MTPLGIEPANFQFVTQCLNQCATVKRSLTDSQFKRWFPDISGVELGPHIAGGLVEAELMTMTSCAALVV
jgi:hypothetical protein